jgi:hypothetical protein
MAFGVEAQARRKARVTVSAGMRIDDPKSKHPVARAYLGQKQPNVPAVKAA